MLATPLILNASATPGIRKTSPILGSASMFFSVSMRLFPRLSGMAIVWLSRTRNASPGLSPRGEQSIPEAVTLDRIKNGECCNQFFIGSVKKR